MTFPAPTYGKVFLTECCRRPVWLCVRGYHGASLTWTGVPCSKCQATYTVEGDTSDRTGDDWQEMPANYVDMPDVHYWAIPQPPPGGYEDGPEEDDGT